MRRRSIRFKMTAMFSAILVGIVLLTFAAVHFASSLVLRKNVRDFLISTVEENVSEIRYLPADSTELTPEDIRSEVTRTGDILLPYSGGYLVIDEDFLEVVSDVYAGLYNAGGQMLYGENPLLNETEPSRFEDIRLWHLTIEGTRYDIYDRRLSEALPGGEALWIRGIVPETGNVMQLRDISRLSLAVLPVILLIAIAATYLMARRLLEPIHKMEQAAGRISGGRDLKARLDMTDESEELSGLAEILNSMFGRLERSFETEQQFTSDASHELRTPMSVILAECEYMLEDPHSEEEYREALETIHRQGDRMNVLISDMLDYTRMEQSSERYPLEMFDLSALTEEVAADMRMIPERGISIETAIEPAIRILGNRLLGKRLLTNLISNAYRYGNDNGHIWVTLRTEAESPVLSVIDDGIGIAPDNLERIWERFFRGQSPSGEVKGTGIGLAMVRKIADIHGAEVSVDSTPGYGSTFRVCFPPSTGNLPGKL